MKRFFVTLSILIFLALATAAFLPSTGTAQAGNEATVSPGDDAVAAGEYCVKKGGEVEARAPYYNTNDVEQNWFRLAGNRQFCRFQSKKDGSRIYVLLTTMYTKQPTLAALAYYAEVPFNGVCNGSPGSCYCSQIGGTDLFGGINANGGGWVQKTDPDDPVLDACIFPDLSIIDSYGLFYHSAGIIRGQNLANVLRYPDPYPKK